MPVMLDSELAEIYGVGTKVFNQAVKRNIDHSRFQLTEIEYGSLKSHFVTSSTRDGRRYYLCVHRA